MIMTQLFNNNCGIMMVMVMDMEMQKMQYTPVNNWMATLQTIRIVMIISQNIILRPDGMWMKMGMAL